MKLAMTPLVLFLALSAPAALAGEDMYRSVMPDGSVRYGESPERGAKSVKRIPPPPASTGTIVVTPAEQNRHIKIEEGSVAVMPTPARESPVEAAQGRLHAPKSLPGRSY